jgi:hypothetical protein
VFCDSGVLSESDARRCSLQKAHAQTVFCLSYAVPVTCLQL